jgi:hypothetical protein
VKIDWTSDASGISKRNIIVVSEYKIECAVQRKKGSTGFRDRGWETEENGGV